jgi:formylglycine-generating enzyme required for sulfatase activity
MQRAIPPTEVPALPSSPALGRARPALLVVFLAAIASAQQARVPDRIDPAAILLEREGMVLVPAGEFTMGSDREDTWADADESPPRVVQLPAFFIDELEVTNIQYKRFLDATGWRPPPGWKDGAYPEDEDFLPVTEVTWWDATAYARWAGKRLPTEAEWEKAARDGDARRFPWGDAFTADHANNDLVLLPVGTKSGGASPYGALDMAGNVAEWTASAYAPYPKLDVALPAEFGGKKDALGREARGAAAASSTAIEVATPAAADSAVGDDPRLAFFSEQELRDTRPRVYRGGSFNSFARFLRCANRERENPDARWPNLGFRCAADVGGPAGSRP